MAKILVVDDNFVNRTLLKETLVSFDKSYQIQEADSGKACLDAVEKESPDLVLLDVMMPDMSGIEVCEKLKKQNGHRDIPIVFVTAMTAAEDLANGFKVGAADYITKPINAVEVRARVSAQLKAKAAEDHRLEAQKILTLKDMVVTYNHNMNQPLMAAFMYLDALATKVEDEKTQESLGKIKNSLTEVKTILAKIEAIKEVKRQNYVGDTGMIEI